MYKITKTYTDYNGVERKEDLFFHLSEAELIEMQASAEGGLVEQLQIIVDAKKTSELVRIFKDLVLRSYGEKSPDGKRFIKNDAIREAFSQTVPYSEIFMELATDDEKAAAFVNGIMPASISKNRLENATKPETGVAFEVVE